MTLFLSPVALDFLWESIDAGELPYPLEARSHGHTMDERSALRQQVYGELRAQRLVDGGGRVEPRLADWLTLLARGTHSIDLVSTKVAALAAGDGFSAVLATQAPDGLWLRAVDPAALASSVVDLLPRHPRGTERSITLSAEDLQRGPSSRFEAEVLAHLGREHTLGGGQLAVNVRSPLGGRTRSPVLAWFDTESGRYLTYSSKAADGTDWVTIAPADAQTLRHRLGELLRTTAHRQ